MGKLRVNDGQMRVDDGQMRVNNGQIEVYRDFLRLQPKCASF